jgi:hypothetical protein
VAKAYWLVLAALRLLVTLMVFATHVVRLLP